VAITFTTEPWKNLGAASAEPERLTPDGETYKARHGTDIDRSQFDWLPTKTRWTWCYA
jgi:hypothetical protein